MISINGISKKYKNKNVIDNVSLDVSAGTCVGILGENGSGKSTLLSILAGVQMPDCGEFSLDGQDLLRDSRLRNSSVAYVPQSTPLIEELTAWDNLRMWYSRTELERDLKEGFLGMLGVDSFIRVPVNQMSGGMKKRLAIGCAIHAQPKLLLLDEPTAALDLICKERIYTYFDNFKKTGGSIILATHEVREIEQCDSCYIIKDCSLKEYEYKGDVFDLIREL